MLPSPELIEYLHELPSRRVLHMLKQIAALLRKHAERRWDERLLGAAARLKLAQDLGRADQIVASMQEILALFSGNDSLRDVSLSDQAGHKIKPEQVQMVNGRLDAMRILLVLSARQTLARLEWRRRRNLPG